MLATETNIIKERLLKSYNIELDHSGISGERIAERLNEISKIGLTEDNGSNRIGFSKEERMAKELVKSWMEMLV